MKKTEKIAFLLDIGVSYQEAQKLDLEGALAVQLDKDPKLSNYIREFRIGAHLAGGPGKGLRQRLKERNLHDWRIDFVWLQPVKIALEVEGAVWSGGRHTRASGFLKDVKKYNTITLAGFKLLRVTAEHVFQADGYIPAVTWIKRAMGIAL